MENEDSFIEFPLNRTISTPLNSLYYISFENCSFKTPEDEMVSYFYKEMLKTIVDKMEVTIQDTVESIPSGDRCFIRANLNYTQVCDEEELMEQEQEMGSDNVLESRAYIGQVPSKRRTTSILKRDRRAARRKSIKYKKKMASSSTTTPKYSTLTSPSQLKYHLDDQDTEENVIIKFQNGNVYTGSMYMKMFHGVGEYRWSDGTVYQGDFCNGEITGTGKYIFSDLSIYEGDLHKSYPHGYGRYYLRHSTVAYAGNWYLGAKQGTGCIHFNNNNWYDGAWKENRMQGTGIRYYPSGAKYQGEFSHGKRHGHGCVVFSNNDFYDGQWAAGKRNGFGQYIWKPYRNYSFCIPVRNIYNGMWKQDCMHGKGELNFGTFHGSRYIGQFCFNQKHGGGLIICENGTVFQSTPMFMDNKPLLYTEHGEMQTSECNDNTSSPILPATPQQSTVWIPEKFEERPSIDSQRSKIEIQSGENSIFNIEAKTFRFPSTVLEKQTRAAINLCKLQFPRKPERTYPIRIPLSIPADAIDLSPLVRRLLEMIHGCTPLSNTDSFIVEPNTWEEVGVKMSHKQLNYDYQEIYGIEEKGLRRAIHINLKQLQEIYKQYSLVGCLQKVPYETLMNRLFLWQMYRDCKVSEKGVSLSYIDVMLAEDSITFSESIHDPFENIYFWQFLTSLLKTSWEVYGSKTIKYVFEGRSILEKIFTKFLKEDIYPNVGHHLGTALFDYKDVAPLKSVYNWFKSIEEPMSIKTFVLNIFSLNKRETHPFEPIPKDYYIRNGTNISVGNNVVFLAEEEPKYCIGPKKILPLAKKCLKKKLYFLRDLGTRLIYKKIRIVVPGIFLNKECFNHEYKLSFLEFYEIVLICTQHILRKKELKFKKKNAKISGINDNVLLKVVTSKKSKQYRKSASHHSIGKRATS